VVERRRKVWGFLASCCDAEIVRCWYSYCTVLVYIELCILGFGN